MNAVLEREQAEKDAATKAARDADNLKQWQWEQERKNRAAVAKADCDKRGSRSA